MSNNKVSIQNHWKEKLEKGSKALKKMENPHEHLCFYRAAKN